jgi:hypothetical protein
MGYDRAITMFSPDGKRTVYIAQRIAYIAGGVPSWSGKFVVVDGVEGKTYDGVTNITFSPDGRRIGYVAESLEWYK